MSPPWSAKAWSRQPPLLINAGWFDVTKEGKTGAFLLMFAFPMFLGAHSTLSYAPTLRWLAWIFAAPGIAYSWYSLVFQYWPAARRGLADPVLR